MALQKLVDIHHDSIYPIVSIPVPVFGVFMYNLVGRDTRRLELLETR